MPKRWCIDCGNLYDLDTTRTHRCPACQHTRTQAIQARPSSSSRGLGWAFSARKAADQAYQQATHCQCHGCPWCGTSCHRPFTPANPKTAGHLVPRSQGGHGSAILAICRSCNSADGGTLAHHSK